jgi:hypothetical protein
MAKARSHRRRKSKVLTHLTPFPWRRNDKGNLIGANGLPIFFQGANAVVVEKAPVLLDCLISIRNIDHTSDHEDDCSKLFSIWKRADDLIVALERAYDKESLKNQLPVR